MAVLMPIVNVWRSNRYSKSFLSGQDSVSIAKGFMELANQDLSAYLMIGSLAILVLGALLYGIYTAFGAGSVQLTDQIEEHSRLHKLGIAHSHQGQGRAVARGGHAHPSHDVIKS